MASRQAGHISYAQLRGIGLGRSAIHHRVRCGRLHRIHRGVYCAGHWAAAPLAAQFAAFLFCGPDSTVARRAALTAWRLIDRDPQTVDLIAPSRRCEGTAEIEVHVGRIPRRLTRRVNGLPVTSPALTILDVAIELEPVELDLVIGKARSRNLVRPSHFHELRSWQPRRRGWKALGPLVERQGVSRSIAESHALGLVAEAGLGELRRNVRLHGFEVDLWLPDLFVVIEIDGFTFHSSRRSFEADRRRDAVLRSRGIEVWRLSWSQVTTHRRRTIAELRAWAEMRRLGAAPGQASRVLHAGGE